MEKRKIFALAACLTVSAVCVTGVFAQVTVSGGFALSSVKEIKMSGDYDPDIEADVGLGGNLFVDYLLPLSIPLSLGFEAGVDGASFESGTLKDTITAIPLLLRAAYHFDLLPKLDLYVVGKIGYVIGIWTGENRDYFEKNNTTVDAVGGVGFGIDVGAAYYFNSKFGLFAEAGFDDYALETKIKNDSFSATLKAPFNRFLTFGVSGKF
ncbi:MAG: porin family protein [Spirochaetaceae bacterium]|jgi:hypothetical protein|nr:porin family protein [Spirochaetaceae bacterium]